MVSADLVCLPDSLQVAGKRSACADDIVSRLHDRTQRRERGGLCQRSAVQLHKLRNGAHISCLDDRLEIGTFADNAAKALQFIVPLLLCFLNFRGVCGMIACFPQKDAQRLHRLPGIAHSLDGIKLICMEAADIDGRKRYILIAEQPLGAGGEVCHAGADSDYAVRFLCDLVGRGGSGNTDAAQAVRMAGPQGALSSLRFTERKAELFTELLNLFARLGIAHAAADDDDRLFGSLDDFSDIFQFLFHRHRPGDPVYPLYEEAFRIVIRFSFHILRKGNRHRAGLSRVSQHAHRIDQRAHQLLGTLNPVPILADRLERIVRRNCKGVALLNLLQHRVRLSGRIGIRREYQQRNVVDRRGTAGGDHVGRAGADRGCAGDDLLPVILLRIRDCAVAHALFVSSLHHLDASGIRVKRFAESDRDSMAKQCEECLHELCFFSVSRHILLIQKLYDRLCRCQSDCFLHQLSPFSLGSRVVQDPSSSRSIRSLASGA